MNFPRNLARSAVVIIIVVIALMYMIDLIGYSGLPASEVKELTPVEIREYQGEQLSSITGFRENSIKGPQYVEKEDYRLTITGLVNGTKTYTYDDIVAGFTRYGKVVTLYCVEGWDVTIFWEGVLVRDVLEPAGIQPSANTVIFSAYDGYSTSFPLDYLIDNDIILADTMNGVTLPPERGFPFELVAEDKWGYKWIKWVTSIELSDDESYTGYWESRGFAESGNLSETFYG